MVGAVLAWLVATVLLILAIVLSVTLVLLPVGLLLGFASFRLYRLGLKLIMPRPSDIQKGVRKELRGGGPSPCYAGCADLPNSASSGLLRLAN